jgi:arylformamidase
LRFVDVSMMIAADMIVYPDNPHPSIRQYSSIPEKKTNESLISIGSHTGTHVDAQMHIQENGNGSAALPLSSFYGRCQVIDLTTVQEEIHRSDLEHHQIKRGDIILLKTRNSEECYLQFRRDYVHVKMDAATYLVEKGVKTLGFDYLSVKKFDGDDEVHSILINNLTLFEGLNLAGVFGGEYIFIGLPLRINCDGAPARIILIDET